MAILGGLAVTRKAIYPHMPVTNRPFDRPRREIFRFLRGSDDGEAVPIADAQHLDDMAIVQGQFHIIGSSLI